MKETDDYEVEATLMKSLEGNLLEQKNFLEKMLNQVKPKLQPEDLAIHRNALTTHFLEFLALCLLKANEQEIAKYCPEECEEESNSESDEKKK